MIYDYKPCIICCVDNWKVIVLTPVYENKIVYLGPGELSSKRLNTCRINW